jgi:hypothetical protein
MNFDEKKKRRFEFLRKLYDMSDGISLNIVTKDLANACAMDYGTEASQIGLYLNNEGLVSWISFDIIYITHKGIKVVEDAIEKPDEPTDYFPPINYFIKVEKMHNSQIMQGSTGINQIFNLTENSSTELKKFIELFEQRISELPFKSEEDKSEAVAEVQTIKTQLTSPRPKVLIIQESIRSVTNILEGFTGSMLATMLIEYLKRQ